MNNSREALSKKLVEMYPEIIKHNIQLDLDFNSNEDVWNIDLKKGEHTHRTYLANKDAEECLNDIKCVYLGIQIGLFIQRFEEDEPNES